MVLRISPSKYILRNKEIEQEHLPKGLPCKTKNVQVEDGSQSDKEAREKIMPLSILLYEEII